MKRIFALLFALVLSASMVTVAFADTDVGVGSGVAGDGATTPSSSDVWTVPTPDELLDLPDVTTQDVVDKLEQKGNDVMTIVQTVGRIVAAVVFIVSFILVVVGAVGDTRLMAKAFVGLAISGIGYAAITCGRELLAFFSAWVQS